MPLTVEIPPKTFMGTVPTRFTRNGLPANGQWTRNAIARQLNHLLAYHGQIIPGKSVAPADARNSSSNLRLWTQYYRATPNGTTLICDVNLIPTDTTAGSPRWYVKVDGVAQDDQFHNVRCAAGAGTTFTDAFPMTQEIAVTAGAKHQIDLFTDDNCRVIGWNLCEKPRSSLDNGTDTLADYSRVLPLSPIDDASIASIRVACDAVFQKHRGCHVGHHVDDPATPISVSSTTAAFLFDTAGDTGVVVPTQYRNTYGNENLLAGVANKSIPCVAWVYGERTAGAGNVIGRFIGGNHTAGVDVTINGALGMYTSTSFTELPDAAHDLIKFKYLVSAGGTTGKIYDFGLFPLIGT